ncbi:MAG: RNA polymerase sigma factor [Oscillospiraceae bacterium]|nr:RNA polymerase sigma factor [Oscillospiraceae bacterium]
MTPEQTAPTPAHSGILELYEAHKQMVYRLALSYTKSPQDAEDVCQTAFLRLLEHRGEITPRKERQWLATVTANLCKSLLRSAWRRKTEPLDGLELPFDAPEENEVFQAVMSLKEEKRAVIYLYYYEGYSTAEVGQILGLKRSTVSTRLDRARKRLKTKLEADYAG